MWIDVIFHSVVCPVSHDAIVDLHDFRPTQIIRFYATSRKSRTATHSLARRNHWTTPNPRKENLEKHKISSQISKNPFGTFSRSNTYAPSLENSGLRSKQATRNLKSPGIQPPLSFRAFTPTLSAINSQQHIKAGTLRWYTFHVFITLGNVRVCSAVKDCTLENVQRCISAVKKVCRYSKCFWFPCCCKHLSYL